MSEKRIVVIGCGFSGLAAATFLADKASSSSVLLLEKNDSPGGRARKFQHQGFVFDMGPSWYWMPNVLDDYFSAFGKKTSDFYELIRLDPSYLIVYGKDDVVALPANLDKLKKLFEDIEPGSGASLDRFLQQAQFNYQVGMKELVTMPCLSMLEFFSPKLLLNLLKMNIHKSMASHVKSFFTNEKIIRIIEFPVLFLGETAENISAAYSLMNYADIVLGTWYPKGGMHEIIKGMVSLAEDKGVKIRYSSEVKEIIVEDNLAKKILLTSGEIIETDIIVAGADYHHVDSELLKPEYRNYNDDYWNSRGLAPSCLIFYLGINKKLQNLKHHNLFFDEPFDLHADAIYNNPRWPERPEFYVSVPSITDSTVAPEGMENVFILIPLAPGLIDTQEIREKYYDIVMDRLENITDQEIRSYVIYKKSYAHNDFITDYHAYKGNAYGLANIIFQSAIFKPRIKNYNIRNLYYTGQLTVPGPGVPTCIISGEVVAKQVFKDHLL